jgi:hypothetical protein
MYAHKTSYVQNTTHTHTRIRLCVHKLSHTVDSNDINAILHTCDYVSQVHEGCEVNKSLWPQHFDLVVVHIPANSGEKGVKLYVVHLNHDSTYVSASVHA